MINYNFETGKLICNANIKEVERFIKGHMGKLDFMYRDSEKSLKTSSDPRTEAEQANRIIAREAGIKTAEEFEKANGDIVKEYESFNFASMGEVEFKPVSEQIRQFCYAVLNMDNCSKEVIEGLLNIEFN